LPAQESKELSSHRRVRRSIMRQFSLVIAVALLGTAVAGCADPYYGSRYGYAYRTYSYPSSYTVYRTAPAAPVQVAYVYPASYTTYRSYDYDRNYMGIHPGPELERMYP
jgi:hypothetical protein